MLASERYDVRLFHRVEEYFNRFYVPRNPHSQATLEEVDVIFNSYLDDRYFELKCYFTKAYLQNNLDSAKQMRSTKGNFED